MTMILPQISPQLLSSKPFSVHFSPIIEMLHDVGSILAMSLQKY